jgi:hypothetical protein
MKIKARVKPGKLDESMTRDTIEKKSKKNKEYQVPMNLMIMDEI